MCTINKEYIKTHIKHRKTFSHKGDYGHALIIAGHKGYMGAAVIAAKAGLRAGVGMLTVSTPKDERLILQCAVPEAMLTMREENKYDIDKFSAVGIGPGLGTDTAALVLLTYTLSKFKKPLLLDADALNMLANNKKLWSNIAKNTIITPHIAEFDRLFGEHASNDDRINTAMAKAKEHHIIIVLKGHHTAIISAEKIFYNTTGNAGLAKGGSGDALTGIITSFLAQGYLPLIAANVGVYVHGLAADITLKKQSMESMRITDVIHNFGKAFKSID